MAHIWQTQTGFQAAADDAAMLLHAELVAAGLVNRRVEQAFVGKNGGSVDVWIRPTLTGNFDESTAGATTLSNTDNQQTKVNVDATKYAYIKQLLTSKQLSFDVDDFTFEVVAPAVEAVAEQVEQFHIRRIAGGFARNLSGTAGTAPSTVAHILNARKAYEDRKAPMRNLAALIGTTAETSFLQLDNFANSDYGMDGPNAMREAMLARRWGIGFFVTPNAGTFAQGDVAGTVLVNGASQTGTNVAVDGFTASTGTVREGTRFTMAGLSNTYTVTADTAIASNAATLPLDQSLESSPADDAAVTFQTAFTQDVLFNTGAVAGAVIAPEPLAVNSVVGRFESVSIRLTIATSVNGSSGAVDELLVDTFCGCRVIRHQMGQIIQG